MCHHQKYPLGPGETRLLQCEHIIMGRLVVINSLSTLTYLTLCEVQVFGTRGVFILLLAELEKKSNFKKNICVMNRKLPRLWTIMNDYECLRLFFIHAISPQFILSNMRIVSWAPLSMEFRLFFLSISPSPRQKGRDILPAYHHSWIISQCKLFLHTLAGFFHVNFFPFLFYLLDAEFIGNLLIEVTL